MLCEWIRFTRSTQRIVALLVRLNEKQRRLYVGFELIKSGHGGDDAMSEITGISVKTIARGRKELLLHNITSEKIREEGQNPPPKSRQGRFADF